MGDRAFAAAVRQHLDGDLGAAIGGYRRVLASDPNHADALNNLGGALMRHERGSAAEAEHVLARAVRLRPPPAQPLTYTKKESRRLPRSSHFSAYRASLGSK